MKKISRNKHKIYTCNFFTAKPPKNQTIFLQNHVCNPYYDCLYSKQWQEGFWSFFYSKTIAGRISIIVWLQNDSRNNSNRCKSFLTLFWKEKLVVFLQNVVLKFYNYFFSPWQGFELRPSKFITLMLCKHPIAIHELQLNF